MMDCAEMQKKMDDMEEKTEKARAYLNEEVVFWVELAGISIAVKARRNQREEVLKLARKYVMKHTTVQGMNQERLQALDPYIHSMDEYLNFCNI